jgi:type IV secretion system protein VirB5
MTISQTIALNRRSRSLRYLLSLFVALLVLTGVPPARAQFAVVDVAALAQLVQQVQTLAQQLAAAQALLTQAQSQYAALTGPRGMQQLLADAPRNYLPRTGADIDVLLAGGSAGFGGLAGEVATGARAVEVLTPGHLADLTPDERALVMGDRQRTALAAALSREALATASERFNALQALITALGGATDPKAVLDLQARIAAEQVMVNNESIKLRMLAQTLAAAQAQRDARVRELAVADVGSLRDLPPLGLRPAAPGQF